MFDLSEYVVSLDVKIVNEASSRQPVLCQDYEHFLKQKVVPFISCVISPNHPTSQIVNFSVLLPPHGTSSQYLRSQWTSLYATVFCN